MSLSNNRWIRQDNAKIIAAVIVTCGTILVSLISGGFLILQAIVLKTDNTPKELARITPTLFVAKSSIPFTSTPTIASNLDQQIPSPGANIAAGNSYSKRSVSVTLLRPIVTSGNNFSFKVVIGNQSNQELLIVWRNSFVHAQDDKGNNYKQVNQNKSDWDAVKQFSSSLSSWRMDNDSRYYNSPWYFDFFVGPIEPNAKYLIVTFDQFAGMSTLTWKYDLP